MKGTKGRKLLHTPPPQNTLAKNLDLTKLDDPINVLNFFEPYIAPEVLEPLLVRYGVPVEEAHWKIRHYVREKDHLAALIQRPTNIAPIDKTFTILTSPSILTRITSPRTLYSYVS